MKKLKKAEEGVLPSGREGGELCAEERDMIRPYMAFKQLIDVTGNSRFDVIAKGSYGCS